MTIASPTPDARNDDVEELRRLKARYCRFLDTKDIEAYRRLFADDVVVTLDMAVATGGADPQTTAPMNGLDEFFPVVWGVVENATTVHHCHTPEIDVDGDVATGIWAMEDLLYFADGSSLHGAGHYHETYAKVDAQWCITSLHLTRTLLRFTAPPT